MSIIKTGNMKLLSYIKKLFTTGVVTVSRNFNAKNFLQYYAYFISNWIWTIGSVVFICLFINSGLQSKGSGLIFYLLSLIPYLLLVFNVITEYMTYAKTDITRKMISSLTFFHCILIVSIVVFLIIS